MKLLSQTRVSQGPNRAFPANPLSPTAGCEHRSYRRAADEHACTQYESFLCSRSAATEVMGLRNCAGLLAWTLREYRNPWWKCQTAPRGLGGKYRKVISTGADSEDTYTRQSYICAHTLLGHPPRASFPPPLPVTHVESLSSRACSPRLRARQAGAGNEGFVSTIHTSSIVRKASAPSPTL